MEAANENQMVASLYWLIITLVWLPSAHGIKDKNKIGFLKLTIHGGWPQDVEDRIKEFSKKDKRDTAKLIKDMLNEDNQLKADLEKYWPAFDKTHGKVEKYPEFWAHEWLKHGVDSGLPLKTFFRQVIDTVRQYIDTFIPEDLNFVNKDLSVGEMLEELKKVFGSSVELNCPTRPGSSTSYVMEIKIHVDKEFKLIEPQLHNRAQWNKSIQGKEDRTMLEYEVPLQQAADSNSLNNQPS